MFVCGKLFFCLSYILVYKSKNFEPILALKVRGLTYMQASCTTIFAAVAAARCRCKQLQCVPTALLPMPPPAVYAVKGRGYITQSPAPTAVDVDRASSTVLVLLS